MRTAALLSLPLTALLALAACGMEEAVTEPAEEVETPAAAAEEPAAAEEAEAEAPAAAEEAEPTAEAGNDNPLYNPSLATEEAPATYTVKFETTAGDLFIDVDRSLSPRGADRFYNLVKIGFYDDLRFFRVIDNFMAQIGISGDPKANRAWRTANLMDDPVKTSNKRGWVTFAKTGAPNSRSTQIFLNFKDNAMLDGMGFAPFGQVREESLSVLDAIYSGYGEGAPRGAGPDQGRIQAEGNAYLDADFPKLTQLVDASIVE